MDSKIDLGNNRHLIDWDVIRWHRRQLTPQRGATHLKFIYRWAPTNARNVETHQGDDSMCPLCNKEHKTIYHVLECTSEAASAHRQRAMIQLESALAAKSTCPHLITLVITAVSLPSNEDLIVHTMERRFHFLIAEQEAIGWDLVKYRYISK